MAKEQSGSKAGVVTKRFELVEGSASKFWEVSQNGSEWTVRFGRIGTEGQAPKTKDAGTQEKATAEVEKLIREKTAKGYKETSNTTTGALSGSGNKKAASEQSSPTGEEIPANAKEPLTLKILEPIIRKENSNFDKYDAITVEAAASLAQFKGDTLELNGLTNLSDAAAKSLAQFKGGTLELNGLTSLSDAAAESLAQSKHTRYLNGLTSLSDAAAKSLAQFKGDTLELNGLTSLSDAAAASLAQFKGDTLELNGLTSLSDAAAKFIKQANKIIKISDKFKSFIKNALNEPIWPGLFLAQKAGATHVRTIFNGWNDDGCYEHQVLKNGKEIRAFSFCSKIEDDMDDIAGDSKNHYADNNGSVYIMELDLNTGEIISWSGDEVACETDRLAEFLLQCEWNNTSKIQATLSLPDPQDGFESVSKVTTEPLSAKKVFKGKIDFLLNRLRAIEDCEELLANVRAQCGESVTLDIDVAKRTFEFSGNKKKVKVSVPENHLGGTKSQVEPWDPFPKAQSKPKSKRKN